MKKAFGQTVRDLKREVNKKVLKVPGIEQKVLDATSNEPWGPHGSLLADIAQASRNYHEYQMIMSILWKRISDTGKNWRHVYKALTVLEYMVAHGSERIIDEIRERAYQISTLSDFQYIDSSGRDQGNNVRKKSQSLVALVNDKERIAEVRQKAAANRDKFRSSAAGGMHRPYGGYGDRYDYESRYGGRDEERSSYGREYGYRDEDRSSRDGDRYSRDYEDRYGRDGYRDDDYRGRSRSVDKYQYGSRSRSADREQAFEDDGQSSSRGSNAKADDHSQDGRQLERKFSEQNIAAPPSYEEAVSESRSPVYSERDGGETPQLAAQTAASPSAGNTANKGIDGIGDAASPPTQEFETFDEFDPRGPVSAGPLTSASASASAPADVPSVTASGAPASGTMSGLPASSNVEMDLLGSLSDAFSPNPMAIVPVDSTSVESNGQANSVQAPSFSASQPSSQVGQPFDDPFGESPFKATPSDDTNLRSQQGVAAPFQQPPPTHTPEAMRPTASKPETADNFGFGDTFSTAAVPNPSVPDIQPPSNLSPSPQDQSATPQNEIDILAGILPPSGPPASLPAPAPTSQVALGGNLYENFQPQPVSAASSMPAQTPFGQAAQPYGVVSYPQNLTGGMPFNGGGFIHQPGSAVSASSQTPQYTPGMAPQLTSGNFPIQPGSATSSSGQTPFSNNPGGPAAQLNGGNFVTQPGPVVASHVTQQAPSGPVAQHGINVLGDAFSSAGQSFIGTSSQGAVTPATGALDIVPQPSKKFEPKSAIWADTLSRGLVNFNISGPKTNPLADIGVDFDAINRKEKRLEKPTTTTVTSTVTMGKAMGSGTGLGRTGAGAMRTPPNPMVGSGMVMGGGGYGVMNQPMGMAMGMGMNMNMGMGQGYTMQPQPGMAPGPGMPPRPGMPGTYNPMMGPGGYTPQQPYGGGYR